MNGENRVNLQYSSRGVLYAVNTIKQDVLPHFICCDAERDGQPSRITQDFLQLRAISTENIIGDRDQKERQRRNEEGSKAGTFMSIRITSLAIRQEPRSFLCSTTIMRK